MKFLGSQVSSSSLPYHLWMWPPSSCSTMANGEPSLLSILGLGSKMEKWKGISLCISLLGLLWQRTTNRGLMPQKFTYPLTVLTVLQARSPTSMYQSGLVPSENCKEKSVPCLSPSYSWLAGNLWVSLPCGSITPISALVVIWHSSYMCVSVSNFPCYIRTCLYWIRAHPHDLILTNYVCEHPIPNKVTCWGTRD